MTVFWCVTHGIGQSERPLPNDVCEVKFHHVVEGECVVVELVCGGTGEKEEK